MQLQSLLLEFRRNLDPLRGFELVATLSRLHRVQGGEDIVVAVEHVAQLLDELGVEHRVEMLRGPLGLHEHWGLLETRGWRLQQGRIERRTATGWKEVSSTRDTPLTVVVGSPPGTVEARVSPEPRQGEVLLAPRFSRILYHDAEEQGVAGIAAFHQGPGVRYWAIYPPLPLPEPRTPAVSIPLREALELLEDRPVVRIEVEAQLHTTPTTPILYAWVGEGPHEVMMIAHICHPRPGSHDNASGAAAVVEALAALSRKAGDLKEHGFRVSALLIPEWTGTAAAAQQSIMDPDKILSAISVDMVAANLQLTGGALRIVRGPPPLLNPVDPILHKLLETVDPEGYAGMTGYEMGSDHDVMLGLGVPASMLNEWPDRYYHTSQDTPDHISVERLASIPAALAAAHYTLALNPEKALEHLLDPNIYTGYEAKCSTKLLSATKKQLLARLKGEAEQPPPPTRRPPLLASYLYHAGLKKEARSLEKNRKTLEQINTYLEVLAATGDQEAAIEAVECVHGTRLEENYRRLADSFAAGEITIKTR